MYEVDYSRGFAYQGNKGFVIKRNSQGMYIKDGLKKIFLTKYNTKVIGVIK